MTARRAGHRKKVRPVVSTEQRFGALLDIIAEGIALVDTNGRIAFVNDRMAEACGETRDAIIGRSFFDFIPDDQLPHILRQWKAQPSDAPEPYEVRIDRADGQSAYLLGTVAALKDTFGQFSGALVTATDITARRRLEDERERSLQETQIEREKAYETAHMLEEERVVLDAIMENTSSHLVYLDRDFNVVKANRAYCEALGNTQAELVGRNHSELFPNQENRDIFEKVRDTGATVKFHDKAFISARHPELGVTYWDWTLVAIKDRAGEVAGLVLSLSETTERVRAEETMRQYERLAILGRVGGSISHELRNPLGTIDSSSYFLKTLLEKNINEIPESLREKVATHLERINDAVKRSTAVIQSLLDLSQRREAKLVTMDLRSTVSELIEEAKVPRKITVRKIFPDREIPVNIDHDQMRLAIHNILTNAVQAIGDKGAITVTIRNDPDYAVLSISDSGPGIPAENLERVFQPLFSTKAKGIGFGLTIAQLVVERFGGQIKAESGHGQGATFVISLPLAKWGIK